MTTGEKREIDRRTLAAATTLLYEIRVYKRTGQAAPLDAAMEQLEEAVQACRTPPDFILNYQEAA